MVLRSPIYWYRKLFTKLVSNKRKVVVKGSPRYWYNKVLSESVYLVVLDNSRASLHPSLEVACQVVNNLPPETSFKIYANPCQSIIDDEPDCVLLEGVSRVLMTGVFLDCEKWSKELTEGELPHTIFILLLG